jgi:starch-binding outer membrane protein, SusD/RagB family
MKINKQQWLIILAIPLLFGPLSCKKFLDRRPLGAGVNGDVAQGKLEEQVFGLYAATRNWGMTQLPFLMVHSARSDDADKGSTATDGSDSEDFYDNFHYTKDHWLMTAYWDDHYGFISLANNIIHDVDSLGLTDAPSLINKGEAQFMRAWAYFDLVRSFGSVPKIDFKVTNAAQANVEKAPIAVIYALIDADLQAAAAVLPAEWETKFIGRVTKGTASAMLAKAYLFRGNWASALAKAEEVINSHEYELISPYSKLFTEAGENSKESIFEIQNFESANGAQSFTNSFAQYQGVRGSGDWDLGWGWNSPNPVLVNSYEAGDPRKDATILTSGQTDQYGQLVPSSPPLARLYWNKKVHSDPARRAATGDRFSNWLDMTVVRYADVLLIAAESAEELGGAPNITKSLGYLEQVRARARAGNNAILPAVVTTDQATLRTAIRKERRAEFGMEYDRFFDLVRWGIAETTFAAMGITFEPRDKYMPLPQSAIDKSGGKLIQNPDF